MAYNWSKRGKIALAGALLNAPIVAFSVLAAFGITFPPNLATIVYAFAVVSISISSFAGFILLFVAWITPKGRNPLHPARAG